MDNRKILTSTKAGRRMMGFMVAWNNDDSDRLEHAIRDGVDETAFQQHSPETWISHIQAIRARSGALKVVQVLATDEYRMVVLVQGGADGQLQIIEMAVSEDYPHKITEFIQRMPGT